MPFAKVDVTQEQVGVYLQDQIKLGGWVLTLGGRHDWADSQTTDLLAGGTTNQDDTAFTGRAGLTYVFANGIAPYISYATSFLPVAGIDRLGNPFKPSTGRQYEAGIKYQPPGTNALITAAVFDILQSNVLTTDAFDPTFQTQTGEVQVRGFDIDARANITSNLELIGGYAFLDSEITASNDPALLGNQVDLVPRHQASLWTKYRFSEGSFAGLSLGAGVRYTGELYAPLQTPSVTLADAMVSYELGYLDTVFKGAELAVNVTNLFDKYYVQGYCDPTYCSLGQGRLVLGTIKYRW
jgi:iron complex outermembrane receptor protein